MIPDYPAPFISATTKRQNIQLAIESLAKDYRHTLAGLAARIGTLDECESDKRAQIYARGQLDKLTEAFTLIASLKL